MSTVGIAKRPPPSGVATVVGDACVNYVREDHTRFASSHRARGAAVFILRVTTDTCLLALSPDDADKLAVELRAAAKAARGEET